MAHALERGRRGDGRRVQREPRRRRLTPRRVPRSGSRRRWRGSAVILCGASESRHFLEGRARAETQARPRIGSQQVLSDERRVQGASRRLTARHRVIMAAAASPRPPRRSARSASPRALGVAGLAEAEAGRARHDLGGIPCHRLGARPAAGAAAAGGGPRARRTSVRLGGRAGDSAAGACTQLPWRNSLCAILIPRPRAPACACARVPRRLLRQVQHRRHAGVEQGVGGREAAAHARHAEARGDGRGRRRGGALARRGERRAAEARQGVFDERERPLNAEGLGVAVTLDAVQRWLWSILSPLSLDPECLIIALALVERAVSGAGGSRSRRTWRPCTLCAIALASKAWYDSAIFNVDFSSRLPPAS